MTMKNVGRLPVSSEFWPPAGLELLNYLLVEAQAETPTQEWYRGQPSSAVINIIH